MQLSFHYHDLHLKRAFTIARSSTTVRHTLIVALSDDENSIGYGEVSDNSYYPQAHPGVVSERLLELKSVLAKADADNPQALWTVCHSIIGDNSFAMSALDMAAHDLAAKRAKLPLYKFWGLEWDKAAVPISNYTLSINTPELVLAEALQNPWPSYKVKLGATHDVATIEHLRRHLPAETRICVDANAAWTVSEAVAKTEALAEYKVSFIEQPLVQGSHQAMRDLVTSCRHISARPPFIADEDCQTFGDLEACSIAYDAVNIKLTKCGGPTEGLQMAKKARELGLGVMFGCMIESSFGIGCLRHLSPLADFIDLDGALLVANDPGAGIAFETSGRPKIPRGKGSGVSWK